MACDRLQLPHAAGSEPLPEAVDERRASLRLIGGFASRGQLRLPGLHAFGNGDGEAQRLEAEACIDRLDDALEPEIDEARDMCGAAGRHRQADIDRHHLAIDAVEGKLQAAGAHSVAFEGGNDVLHEMGCALNDRLLRADRLEQLAQAVIGGRRSQEGERLGQAAAGLVETPEKLGRKARGKGCARVVEQRADALEAEPPQRCAGVVGKAERLDRQRRKGRCFLPRRQDNRRRAMEWERAQAAPGVSAMASRAGRPNRFRRCSRAASSLSSPPNRCAAPVMSRNRPSAPFASPQTDTAGV